MDDRFHNIMVAVDGSSRCSSAVIRAVLIAKTNKAKLFILVVTPENCSDDYFNASEILERSVNIVNLVLNYRSDLIELEVSQIIGIPKQEILQFSVENSVDLIVIGGTHLGKVESAIIGSTSHFIAMNAPCSVLIEKQQQLIRTRKTQSK